MMTENSDDRRNVLVLYDEDSLHVNTLREHLDSFSEYSRHNIHCASACGDARCEASPSLYDAVVVHYSVRVNLPRFHMSPSYTGALRDYEGLKVLFIQDDYDTTSVAWRWINTMGIDVVYTCIPRDCFAVAYPPEEFPNAEFMDSLTGFVPIGMERKTQVKPTAQRRHVLGYRGRKLPYWYGTLGQEKLTIGVRMKRICQERNIPCNIEWADEHRIYGPGWYDFIEDCRAVLGTETGANVFDIDGTLSRDITAALADEPEMTFQQAHERFMRDCGTTVTMGVISPKVFEAIALRTALVLFEGDYSGVVKADEHFIPLKKDFSNVDEVLAKLEDIAYLEELTARAHRDIIASGKYSYQAFVGGFDDMLAAKLRGSTGPLPLRPPVPVVDPSPRTAPSVGRRLRAKVLRCKLRMTRGLIVLKQMSRLEPDHAGAPKALNENPNGPLLKISARGGRVRMDAVASLGGRPSATQTDFHARHPSDGLRFSRWNHLGRQSWRYELDGGVCVLWDELPKGHAEAHTDLLSILLPDCFQIHPSRNAFVFQSAGYTLRGDVTVSQDVHTTAEVTRLVGWRWVPPRLRRDPNHYRFSVPPTRSIWDLCAVTVLQAGPEAPPKADIELVGELDAVWGAKLDVGGQRYLLLGPDASCQRDYPGCERVPRGARPVAIRYGQGEVDVVWAVTHDGLVRFG